MPSIIKCEADSSVVEYYYDFLFLTDNITSKIIVKTKMGITPYYHIHKLNKKPSENLQGQGFKKIINIGKTTHKKPREKKVVRKLDFYNVAPVNIIISHPEIAVYKEYTYEERKMMLQEKKLKIRNDDAIKKKKEVKGKQLEKVIVKPKKIIEPKPTVSNTEIIKQSILTPSTATKPWNRPAMKTEDIKTEKVTEKDVLKPNTARPWHTSSRKIDVETKKQPEIVVIEKGVGKTPVENRRDPTISRKPMPEKPSTKLTRTEVESKTKGEKVVEVEEKEKVEDKKVTKTEVAPKVEVVVGVEKVPVVQAPVKDKNTEDVDYIIKLINNLKVPSSTHPIQFKNETSHYNLMKDGIKTHINHLKKKQQGYLLLLKSRVNEVNNEVFKEIILEM
jgi:hypothetical protein